MSTIPSGLVKPKTLLFDIESTNLNADFGFILCISYKWYDNPEVHTIAIFDSPIFKHSSTNDKWVLKEFGKVYDSAEVVVAHYGKRFDLKFMNTRRAYHGMAPLAPVSFVDTCLEARKYFKLHSNRLASIAAFFKLPDKTPLMGDIWMNAMAGHKKDIRYVVQHCEADVIALEAAYKILLPFMQTHPNVNVINGEPYGCPRCGAATNKRGRKITRTGFVQQYQCKSCGSWSQGPHQKQDVQTR